MNKIANVVRRRIIYAARLLMLSINKIPECCLGFRLRLAIRFGQLQTMRFTLVLDYFANCILFSGLCVGLFDRWQHTQDDIILVLALLGLTIFCVSCAMTYYFSMEKFAAILVHLWFGCLLGVITFTEKLQHAGTDIQELTMNIMFMTCLGLHCFSALAERTSYTVVYEPTLLTTTEIFEMTGMAISGLMTKDYLAVTFLVTSLAVTMIAIRLKSLLGLVILVCMSPITTFWFFPLLNIRINPFSMICFVGRLVWVPVLDLYFSSLSTLDRWSYILRLSSCRRRTIIFCILILELCTSSVIASQLPNHKEWFVVVPMFAVFSFIWLCFHLVFVISCWQLNNKITECNTSYAGMSSESRSMDQTMAAQGIRHFGLISQRLVFFTLVTTVIVGGLGWTTRSGVTVGLFFIVLPIETTVLSLLLELGSALGGTCVGFAVVAPATYHRPGTVTTVLPTTALQELGARSTQILNDVQQFFAAHMVDMFGCDYSSSGMTLEALQSKLCLFFDRRTSDGPRYDTYFLYYCGHTKQNGDWALSANGSLTLNALIELWVEKNADSGARLIIVLDTEFSHNWIKPVKRNHTSFVAIQTCKIAKVKEQHLEDGPSCNLGDFTKDWVNFNSADRVGFEINWQDKERVIKAVYGTSRNWTDFRFHLPTPADITQHWQSNFPKLTRYFIKAANFPGNCNMFCCCDCIVSCLRRKKMKWCQPAFLDTGHGFKIVRS